MINIASIGRRRAVLFATAAMAASLSFEAHAEVAAATTAAAADAQSASLDEVVVTAQKTETNLQRTPISISVLNAENLADRHIQSLEDLNDGSIPSLRVTPFFTRSSALIISLRGVGAMNDANQPNRDQGVGVYVDGVYLGRAQGLGTALYDVERIEVAKGPQGTLFGRNTEGGAISIVTRQPTGAFKMDTTFGVSNYGGYKAETHVDLPSFHDFSVKIDGLVTKRDGTVENRLAGQPNFNSYDRRGLRAEVMWKPNDRFSAEYAYDTSYDATTPYYAQVLSRGSVPLSPIVTVGTTRATESDFGVPLQPSVGNASGHLLVLNWSVAPNITLKSISSYRQLTETQFDDGETDTSAFFSPSAPTATFGRYSLANFWQNQYSQEFQLIGHSERINYLAGAFYYHENVHDNAWTPNPLQWNGSATSYTVLFPPAAVSPFPDRASYAQTSSAAVFGQATWTPPIFNDIAHLTLGGRYTSDHKQGDLVLVNGALPLTIVNGQTVVGVIPLNKTWDRFDPLINLSVDVAQDVSVYAKWSTGYKAGGANSRSFTYRAFDPESVSTAEIGAKSEFFDHRLRFNVAAYTGTYKDPQIDFNANIFGSNRGTVETTNAVGAGKIEGAEVDASVAPIEGLTLAASYAWVHETLPEAPNPFANNVLTPVFALNAPVNTASVSADYERPFYNMKVRAHLDANYSDPYHASASDPTLTDKSFIVNGRLALADIKLNGQTARMQIALWSRNLLNEQNTFNKAFSASVGTYGIYNEPRTYGLDATFRF